MECPSIFIMYKSLRMRTLILRTTASVVIKFELGKWQIMKNCGMPYLGGRAETIAAGHHTQRSTELFQWIFKRAILWIIYP